MNKLGRKSIKYNKGEEDNTIKKVANTKNVFQPYLLIMLSIMFVVMLICSFIWVDTFYKNRDRKENEIIEIKNDKNSILIVNNNSISENLTASSFDNKQNITIERINTLEIKTYEDADTNGLIKYNIRYKIMENPFIKTTLDSTDSEILVRFSYSYDNEEWTYINNVISTDTSTIIPLMGKSYDIAGIKGTLKVATNEELETKPGESQKIYWRSETIIKNFKDESLVKNYKADFKIEYFANN